MKFKNSKKLSGDASFRSFYRNKKNKSIVVFCKKDKFKNLIVYDAINKLLDRNNIKTPHLLKENYKNKPGLGLGIFIGGTLLERNFAKVICRNSVTRNGAEVIIRWNNKDLLGI